MDFLTAATQALFGAAKESIEEVQRGATGRSRWLFANGHQRHVKDCLRDNGIDCWGENTQSYGCSISVWRDDKPRAIAVLKRAGYDAW